MQWDEKKISRLFQIGKSWDEKQVPSFERVLTRSRTTLPARRVASLRFAGLASAGLVGVLTLSAIMFVRGRDQSTDPLAQLQTTPSLLKWRSPTDFLLQTPGHELRDSLPQVGQAAALTGSVLQPAAERGERR